MRGVISGPLMVDTNVWVDYFMGKEARCHDALEFVNQARDIGIRLLAAATSLKDVFFIMPRELKRAALAVGYDVHAPGEAAARQMMAWGCLESIRDVATIAPVTLVECELAHILHKQHADFEDNLIMASAHTCQAEYVVTYDERMAHDFPGDCLTPRQALGLLGRGGDGGGCLGDAAWDARVSRGQAPCS